MRRGRLALPSGLVHGPAEKDIGRRAALQAEAPLVLTACESIVAEDRGRPSINSGWNAREPPTRKRPRETGERR